MKIKAFAILDTNVLVSAVISRSGYPYEILRLVQTGNVIPIFDKRMLSEYQEVFHYEKLKLAEETINATLSIIINNGLFIHDVQKAKEEFVDKSDIPFFEVQESSEEFDSVLVTGNLKHYPEQRYIITPKEFILLLDQMERFLKLDFNYEKNIEQLIKSNIESGKYTEGYKVFALSDEEPLKSSGRQSVMKMINEYKQETSFGKKSTLLNREER